MKHLLLTLLLILLLALGCAQAESSTAAAIALAVHPGGSIRTEVSDGDLTALIVDKDDAHVLMVIRGNVILTDNPTALLPGPVTPALTVSGDDVSWRYTLGTDAEPHSLLYTTEFDGTAYGYVAQVEEKGERTATVWYAEDCVCMTLLNGTAMIPRSDLYHDNWLAGFDTADYPRMDEPLPAAFYQAALEPIVSGYEVLCGGGVPGGFATLCQHPRQSGRTLILCTRTDDGIWDAVLCSRLPGDTECVDGDPCVLRFPSYDADLTCTVTRSADGLWGLSALHVQDGEITLGSTWAGVGSWGLTQRIWGSHPWMDATAISWNTLPRTVTEMQVQVNPAGWGVVDNPEPTDRLHLRSLPDAASKSLGSYATGTPVQVLGSTKGWVNVAIGGREGWMKQEYLALGDAQRNVLSFCEMTTIPEDIDGVACYQDSDGTRLDTLTSGTPVVILGAIGEKWYHVLLPQTDTFALIAMMDLP